LDELANTQESQQKDLKFAFLDFKGKWSRSSRSLEEIGMQLKHIEDAAGIAKIDETMKQLTDHYTLVVNKVAGKLKQFEDDDSHLQKLVNDSQQFSSDIEGFVDKATSLKSIEREPDLLNCQVEECEQMDAEIDAKLAKLNEFDAQWKKMLEEKLCNSAQAKAADCESERLKRQLERCRNDMKQRREGINEMRARIEKLQM
jgi:chromosome segregation ATPase